MKITNSTTTYDIAELMGPEADEQDGRIMMSLLSRDCVVDTDELSDNRWDELLEESQKVRSDQNEALEQGY